MGYEPDELDEGNGEGAGLLGTGGFGVDGAYAGATNVSYLCDTDEKLAHST